MMDKTKFTFLKMSLCLCKTEKYNSSKTPDKNGNYAIFLRLLGGIAPNRLTVTGTHSKIIGIEVGKVYIMGVIISHYDITFGECFRWIMIKEITSPKDMEDIINELPESQVIPIDKRETLSDAL